MILLYDGFFLHQNAILPKKYLKSAFNVAENTKKGAMQKYCFEIPQDLTKLLAQIASNFLICSRIQKQICTSFFKYFGSTKNKNNETDPRVRAV